MDNERKIRDGIIHIHSEYSIKDSVMSMETMCSRAKELGAPAIVLTDHGTLMGVYPFLDAAKKAGIKAIPGVEAYVQEDGELAGRRHLLLIPKNYTGYQAICRAVTASNLRQDSHGFSRMNLEILNRFFGPGSPGHGNVIATSACIGGVLAKLLLFSDEISGEIEKLEEKRKKYSNPEEPGYLRNKSASQGFQEIVKGLMEQRDTLAKKSKMSLAAKKKALAALSPESEGYAALKEACEKAEKEKENAASKLEKVKAEIAELKKRQKLLNQKCRESEKTHLQWREINTKIGKLQKELRPETELYRETREAAEGLRDVFGDGCFYVELQYHGIPQELYAMPRLLKLADELGLPTVACNDAHIPARTYEDRRARQIARSLRYNKWEEEFPGDEELYIKTDQELLDAISTITPEASARRAMEGIGKIISQCEVVFPSEKHYPKFIAEHGKENEESAIDRLRRLAREGISWRYPNPGDWTGEMQKRMEYELDIIDSMGYSDYHAIVEDFLRYGRKLGRENHEAVGMGIGPGRGSAVGSLVCYLVGITSIDPIRYGLIFERFLNPERISMPDIDSDFQTNIREDVIRYVEGKYSLDPGEEDRWLVQKPLCCIATASTQAAKAAITNVARVTEVPLEVAKLVKQQIPNKPKIRLKDVEAEIREKFASNRQVLQLLDDAMLVEGSVINFGVHAAGVIIADNGDVGEYVPLSWNDEKQQWVAQCDMKASEEKAGLLKMDFLGLRNLDIITDTERRIKRNTGIGIDVEKAPLEKEVFENIFAAGRTNSVFQFESSGMKQMLRQFAPASMEDLILLVAAYRPGPMQYLPDIIAVKHKKKKPEYATPELADILKDTYGAMVYQEQVMTVCQKLAGYSLGRADIIRKAMSKKNLEVMEKEREIFVHGETDEEGNVLVDGCVRRGIPEETADRIYDQMTDFASYAFNKSHAAAYAHIAYYTGWLKYHYPVEYMCSVMARAAADKIPALINECIQTMKVQVLPPHINRSEEDFTGKDGVIAFGFNNIKNIGQAGAAIVSERKEKGPFVSLKDFIRRVSLRKDVLQCLTDVGAFDGWCENRRAVSLVLEGLADDLASTRKKEKALLDLETQFEELSRMLDSPEGTALDPEERKKAEKSQKGFPKRIENAKKKAAEYRTRFEETMIPTDIPENGIHKLELEHELLGFYVSGHPLDYYANAKKLRKRKIAELDSETNDTTVCGIISQSRIVRRKVDGKPLGFFTLSDESGSIEIACFTKAFESYGGCIADGNVVKVDGKYKEELVERETVPAAGDDSESAPEFEVKRQIFASSLSILRPADSQLVVTVPNVVVWTEEVYPVLKKLESNDGQEVVVYDRALGEFRETGLFVGPTALTAELPRSTVRKANLR